MVQSRIREIRKEKGLTLQEVADLAGTTAQTIGRLETGTRTLSLKWVNRISKALAVESSALLTMPEQGDIEIIGGANAEGVIEQKTKGTVSTRLFASQPVGIRISENVGNFTSGDLLIFETHEEKQKRKFLVGKTCLIQQKRGAYFLGLVLGASADGRLSFQKLGLASNVMENKKVITAAPLVALVRRFD